MMESLPPLEPDTWRSQRTLARCHARLDQRRRRAEMAQRVARARYLAAERLLVGGLCVIYIYGVAMVAIEIIRGG